MFAPTKERTSAFGTGSLGASPLQSNPTTLQPGGSSPLQEPLQQNLRTSASASSAISGSNLLPIDTIILPPITWITDNTLGTARDVGTLTSTQTLSGFVGNTDTVDFYKLNLGAGGNLNITLTGLAADADVSLIRDFNNNGVVDPGETIAYSMRGGSNDEAINLSGLASGQYFVKVAQYLGNTNYSLKLSTASPSDLIATETDIGALAGTRVFSGAINNNNTSDIYRFNVTNLTLPFIGTIPTGVNVTLSGLSHDADVRLIRDANGNGIVDSGDVLTGSYRAGSNAEWISTALTTGAYFVQVEQYNGDTNYNLSVSTGDWYSSNLTDPGIIGQARAFGADGSFSRNDMMSILRETEDYGNIDASELTDLRKLLSDRGSMMPDYVRNLTNKIVNSDPANPRSGIGNLFAGSSATQMERLIGKWFLGNDRPTTSYSYQYAQGSLFQNGISYTDVKQGVVGDCYLMAALAGTARTDSSAIQNMFIDNGDGTFTVRFMNNGVADYVTVDRYLPTSGGNFVYANMGGSANSSTNELWVALAEKAYAQINQSGWIGQDNTNSYDGISGGWAYNTIKQITGLTAYDRSLPGVSFFGISLEKNVLINAINAGDIIGINSKTSGVATDVVDNHVYTAVGYDAATQRFTLFNPWGTGGGYEGSTYKPGYLYLTWDQLTANFDSWDYAAVS